MAIDYSEPDAQFVLPYMERIGWGAREAGILDLLLLPISNVRYTHTQTPKCITEEDCVKAVKKLQRKAMKEDGLADIPYNFLVGGNGLLLEGRGWKYVAESPESFAPVRRQCLVVALIGDYTVKNPPWPQTRTSLELLRENMPVLHYEPDPLMPLVKREEWQAKPPKENPEYPLRPFGAPVKYVRYTSTMMDKCNTSEECTEMMQKLQLKHMDEGLADVKFNFVVGADGKVYEGRGWNYDADRPSDLDNLKGKCVDIAYTGNYTSENPKWEMLRSGLDILKYGLKHQHVNASFEVMPYRENTSHKPDD